MKVYIIERETPTERLLPEIALDGAKAVQALSEEVVNALKELDIDPDIEGNDYTHFWWISDITFEGSADIDRYGNQWLWRITAHEIDLTA